MHRLANVSFRETLMQIKEEYMTDELELLIEAARRHPFSDDERQAQRRSFAYGNAKIENDDVTWEMIVEADEQIKARGAK